MNSQVFLIYLVKGLNTIVAFRHNILRLEKKTRSSKNYCTVLSLTVSFYDLSVSCGFRNNLIQRGKYDMGSLNQRFCLVEVWEGVDHEASTKMWESKYKMNTYIHTYNINKQISLIFNCVSPDSVLLACQLHNNYIFPETV